jgi:hypothetical protein
LTEEAAFLAASFLRRRCRSTEAGAVMKELNPRIGELAVRRFDEFDSSLRAFSISIGNLTATEDVAAGNSGEENTEQKADENKLAAKVVLAMSKVRLQW